MPAKWRPVTKNDKCLICGHDSWCARSNDGAHRCQRPPPSPPAGWRQTGAGATDGAKIYRSNGDATTALPTPPPKPTALRRTWANVERAAEAIAERESAVVEAIYPYPAADGSVGLWVLRTEPKQFRPLHRTAAGIVAGDPKGPLPLFRLPELGREHCDVPVLVVEGEKCVIAAEGMGLLATTSAHGAKCAAKSDWSPLAGRSVVLCPDADEPGETYIRAVGAILADLNPPAQCRLLRPPGLKPCGDIADWIDEQQGRELVPSDVGVLLRGMIEAAPFLLPILLMLLWVARSAWRGIG